MSWRKFALAFAVFAVSLELALQAFAGVVHALRRTPEQPAGGAQVVCLGDSFTYGIGASTPDASYPAQLQALLRARGHNGLIVGNGGWPGQDSAFMLRRLPAAIGPATRVVCLLMAVNDTWSRPNPVPSDALPLADVGSFTWRWRTGRLLAIATRFAANSWLPEVQAGATAAAPMPEAGIDLLLRLAVLRADDPLPEIGPPPPAPLREQLSAVDRLRAAGDGPAALALARELAADAPASPYALEKLATTAHVQGDADARAGALARLRVLAADDDPIATECLLVALTMTNANKEAFDVARRRVERAPRSLFAWKALQESAFVVGDWTEFTRAAAMALRLGGRLHPPATAAVLRTYARALAPQQPELAAGAVTAAHLLDGDLAATRSAVLATRADVPWPEFDRALAQIQDPRARDRAAAALRGCWHDDGGEAVWGPALRAHMLAIGRHCADRGIRVVVVGYPFANPALERIQGEVAAALGAPFAPTQPRFARELTTTARETLFVRDGHCSDAGYALVAEELAAVVGPLLAR
jgi:lysophospholipase L1-like esterase